MGFRIKNILPQIKEFFYTKSEMDSKISSFHDSTKVNKTGDTITGSISRNSGGNWISARDNAVVKQTRQTQNSGSSWNPVISVKTYLGNWSLGTVGGETLKLSYDTDANYNANPKVNKSNSINFPDCSKNGTLALQEEVNTALAGKANSSHTHTKSQISDFPSTITMTVTFTDNTTKNYTIYGSGN